MRSFVKDPSGRQVRQLYGFSPLIPCVAPAVPAQERFTSRAPEHAITVRVYEPLGVAKVSPHVVPPLFPQIGPLPAEEAGDFLRHPGDQLPEPAATGGGFVAGEPGGRVPHAATYVFDTLARSPAKLPSRDEDLFYVFDSLPVAKHVAGQGERQVVTTAAAFVPRGREYTGEERRHGELAYAPAQLILIHLGHSGGVVAADEVIGALVRVDRGGDNYLVPAAIVGSL